MRYIGYFIYSDMAVGAAGGDVSVCVGYCVCFLDMGDSNFLMDPTPGTLGGPTRRLLVPPRTGYFRIPDGCRVPVISIGPPPFERRSPGAAAGGGLSMGASHMARAHASPRMLLLRS